MSDAQHAEHTFEPTPGTDLTAAIEAILSAHMHQKRDWVGPAYIQRRAGRMPAELAVSQVREIDCLQYRLPDDTEEAIELRIRPEDRDRLAVKLLGGGRNG